MKRFVIAPELLARAFANADCLLVLHAWRDGKIRLVTNRALTLSYLRLLAQLGLSQELARRWLWWFGSKAHSEFLVSPRSAGADSGDPHPDALTGTMLCDSLAVESRASAVIHSDKFPPPEEKKPTWIEARDFIQH